MDVIVSVKLQVEDPKLYQKFTHLQVFAKDFAQI